jgi:hypothetical protein
VITSKDPGRSPYNRHRTKMTAAQEMEYAPHLAQCLYACQAHFQHVTGREAMILLPYPEATEACARAKARILDYAHRGAPAPDHLRRIVSEVIHDMQVVVQRQCTEYIPGIGNVRTTGAIPLDVAIDTESEEILGWCKITGRNEEGGLSWAEVFYGSEKVGHLDEVPPKHLRNPKLARARKYEGEINLPEDRGHFVGIARLVRPTAFGSMADLMEEEFAYLQEKSLVTEEGVVRRRQVEFVLGQYLQQQKATLPFGALPVLRTTAALRQLPPQKLVRQVLLDYFQQTEDAI